MNSKISCAVAAILSGASVGAPAAEPTSGTTGGGTDTLAEVTVTAERRTENLQDVPISIQALTSETLTELNISTFDDYIRYLPNVTTASNGPGQSEIFMRGVSAGSQPSQGSASTGLWPNVAIYLDNQSGQLPNRNLDIYAADLNRIEVLEGPQGTLFGAGAQAGAIRYITNEPKLDVTEGNVKAEYGTTAHGGQNTDVVGVVNLPLVTDTLAVRGVIYNDSRGGYIDNVPATFTRANTDIGIHYANYPAPGPLCPNGQPPGNGYCVPPNAGAINNYNIAANEINPVQYYGIRAELLWKFNPDWNMLITQTYQVMNSQGVFYQQPYASDGGALNPLEVTLFNNSYNNDKFENTAITFNGKFGPLNAVLTGGYLERHVDQIGDYTNYARGVYADYYQCYGPGTGIPASTCFSPSATWHSQERNEHTQVEFRLSTPDDWRLRGILGAFWENNKLYDQTGWKYKTVPPCTTGDSTTGGTPGNTGCFTNIGTTPGAVVQNPGVQSDITSFYQDTERGTKQTAFFASFDFDILPKTLTVTLGGRWFRFDNSSVGSVSGSFFCYEQGAPGTVGCLNDAFNLNADNLKNTETGFKGRGNLTWHITRDLMVYYTFSQGFRPGGFNQNVGAQHAFTPPGAPGCAPAVPGTGCPQFQIPQSWTSDNLTNNEIGWKTEFFDHRLEWNGAIYRDYWDNVQIAFFDPGVVGNIFFNTNGQNFTIKGLETSLAFRYAGLTLTGAVSWNQTEQTNSPTLNNNIPGTPGYGQPITFACRDAFGDGCAQVVNPYGPVGSPAANAPPMQFALRARYQWILASGYVPYVQFGATHCDVSFTQAGANPELTTGPISTGRLRFENPAYSTFDASIGVSKGQWYLNAYGENISNSNASTFQSTDQFIVAQTPLRPRVLGLAFGYSF